VSLCVFIAPFGKKRSLCIKEIGIKWNEKKFQRMCWVDLDIPGSELDIEITMENTGSE
jgi:hypothetical protein